MLLTDCKGEGRAECKEALVYEMSLASESNAANGSLVYLQFEPDKCSCTTSNPLLIFQPLFSMSPPSWPQ